MTLNWRFFVLSALAVIPLLFVPIVEMLGILLLALACVACVDWFCTPDPRAVQFQRTPGPRIRLGESTHATLSLHNSGKRHLRLLMRDAWTPTAGAEDIRFRTTLGPGESQERRLTLEPRRRGSLPADLVTVRSRSIFGLVGRQVSVRVPAAVTIMPQFNSRKHLATKMRKLRELEGQTSVMSRGGGGSEFDSLREYVRGDDVRAIDWRATARAQHLIVRTYRPERDRRIIIVLDSSRLAARRIADETAFDTAIESCLLLAGLAAGSGDRVQVLVADARIRSSLGPYTRSEGISQLMHGLTPLFPDLVEADWDLIAKTVMRLSGQRALVVFLTALDAATIATEMLPAIAVLQRTHALAIASVADGSLDDMRVAQLTPHQVYATAAAEREITETRSLSHALMGMGVHSAHETPDLLPPALADLYIKLKVSGQL